MNTKFYSRYSQPNAEMYRLNQIAIDTENNDSDSVIRAKKEIERIKHDIANLLNAL